MKINMISRLASEDLIINIAKEILVKIIYKKGKYVYLLFSLFDSFFLSERALTKEKINTK